MLQPPVGEKRTEHEQNLKGRRQKLINSSSNNKQPKQQQAISKYKQQHDRKSGMHERAKEVVCMCVWN